MKLIRKTIILVLVIALILGCNIAREEKSVSDFMQGNGVLEVKLMNEIAPKTIHPGLDMTIADYHITITGPGETRSQTIGDSQSTAAFSSLEQGEWTVTVHARNGDDPPVIIAQGEDTATILNEQTTIVDITVLPVEGQGTLDLTIEWPAGVLTSADMTASLMPESGTEQDISSQITIDTGVDPNTAGYVGTLDAGYYMLSLSLTDEGSQVWGNVIAVRIIAAESSVGVYTLQESELSLVEVTGGTFEVNIGADLRNPYTITFNGQQAEIGPTEDMTINAVLDPAETPESYEWYLDGELQEGITGSSITIGPSGIWLADDTSHRLTLLVRDGVTLSSETAIFHIGTDFGSGAGPLPVDPVTPDDDYYNLQWHYATIGMPGAWGFLHDGAYSSNFSGVVVAVIDTGYLDHPDLGGNVTSDGYDFISDVATANDGDGIDPDPTDAGNDLDNPTWHGTHVAGTIAAVTNNNMGVAGIGWDQIEIMPIRVLGVGGGSSYDIIQAILYAAGEPNDSGTVPTNTVSVINMSLGGGGYSQSEIDAIQTAVDKGITVIASAGNDGVSPIHNPAAYNNTIAVSSINPSMELAAYSSYGPRVEFTAPGGADEVADNMVYSTYDIDNYMYMNGTSMAAPHVSGAVGFIYAFNSNLTQNSVRSLLATTAMDLGNTGRDSYFGYGLIQTDLSLTWLTENDISALHTVDSLSAATAPTEEEIQTQILNEIDKGYDFETDRVIIKLKSPDRESLGQERSIQQVQSLADEYSLTSVTGENSNFKLARLPKDKSVKAAIEELAADSEVEYAEPVYRRFPVW